MMMRIWTSLTTACLLMLTLNTAPATSPFDYDDSNKTGLSNDKNISDNGEYCHVIGTSNRAPTLCGKPVQGGLLYGESRNHSVYYKNELVSIGDIFTIGLDRDTPDTIKLKFCNKLGECSEYAYKIEKQNWQIQRVSVPDKFVHYTPEIEKRIERESNEIRNARTARDTTLFFMNMEEPLDSKKFRISGVFGSQRVFNDIPKSPHRGLDFAAPTGTPVIAAAPGRVVLVGDHFMSGNIVMISHGYGIYSVYLHLSKINVSVGQNVSGTTKIGLVGSTGRSSGAHLHFGIYWNQTALDPQQILIPRGTEKTL